MFNQKPATNIKFLSLAARNVKNLESFAAQLYDVTSINADNGQGKTTLKELITFVICGTFPNGSPRVDDLISNGKNQCEGQLAVEVNGKVHEIVRKKSRKESAIFLNGTPAKQVDIERIFGNTELFLAAFNPEYILDGSEDPAKAKERRELLLSLVMPMKPEEIIEQYIPERKDTLSGLNLLDPDKYLKENNQELKNMDKEEPMLEGQIKEIEHNLGQPIPEKKVFAGAAELAQLKAKQTQILNIGVEKPVMEPLQDVQKLAELTANKDQLKNQYNDLNTKYKVLEGKIPPAPTMQAGQSCHTCGQTIAKDHYEKVLADYNVKVAEIKKQMAEVAKQANAVVTEAKGVAAQIKAIEEANAKIQEANAKKQAEYDATLKAQRAELPVIQQRIGVLMQEEAQVHVHNAHVDKLVAKQNQDTKRRVELLQDIKNIKNDRAYLQLQNEAIKAYIQAKVKSQTDPIQSLLKNVKIELFTVAKTTGEIKPAFKFTFSDSVRMSTSERIKAGREIMNVIRTLSGMNFPEFVDNGESITEIESAGTQLIVARVVKGMPLTVKNGLDSLEKVEVEPVVTQIEGVKVIEPTETVEPAEQPEKVAASTPSVVRTRKKKDMVEPSAVIVPVVAETPNVSEPLAMEQGDSAMIGAILPFDE